MSHSNDLGSFFTDDDDARRRNWQKGEFICREGEPLGRIYYLFSGKCRVFRNLNQGRTILYRIYLPGSVIGDIEVFADINASCSVQCMSDAITLSLDIGSIRENRRGYSDMLFRLGAGLARKMHENGVNESINTTFPLETRLAHYYLSFTDPDLQADRLSQLADWMGCSYRHLTRSLRRLAETGAIEKSSSGTYRPSDLEVLSETARPLLEEAAARGLFERGI